MNTPICRLTLACCLCLLTSGISISRAQIGPGQALQFDGLASEIQVPASALMTISNQLTFEAWIHPQKQDCNTILSSGSGLIPSTDTIFDIGWNGSSCGTEMKVGLCISGWYYSTGTVPLSTWTHVAVTCDGANVRFYINGALDSTTPQTTSVSPSSTPLYLGRQGSDCNCNFFLGQMDEIRVWEVARTPSEITNSMNRALYGDQPGLIAYYKFDEGGGTTAVNNGITGGQNDGTLLNGPVWTNSGAPFVPDVLYLMSATVTASQITFNAIVNPGNLPTAVHFEWGPTNIYPFYRPGPTKMLAGTNAALTVSIPLPYYPLRPGIYGFYAVAENSAGIGGGFPGEFVMAPLTDFATDISSNSATLNGFINVEELPTNVYFEWGATTSYGNFSSTNTFSATLEATTVSIPLTGLAPDSTYHYRVVSVNSVGTNYGNDVSFVTLTTTSGTWVPLSQLAPGAVQLLMLLSDGTVMAKGEKKGGVSAGWYRLTPDSQGSYVSGTWSTLASMHETRQLFSSVVLKDGRVFVAGGEYGAGTGRAEVYDPLLDSWAKPGMPAALFANLYIGDASAETLPNGSVIIAPLRPRTANETLIFDPESDVISAGPAALGTPAGAYSSQLETSWVKLPDESILTINYDSTNSQRFIPSLNRWIPDATVPAHLWSFGEIGLAMLLPNGKALFFGGNQHSAIYTPSGSTNEGTWVVGPDLPNGSCSPDVPSAMMINGKILCAFVPFDPLDPFTSPTTFYEYDYLSNRFTLIPAPGGGTTLPAQGYPTRFLDLPDGSVLFSAYAPQLYVYRPVGNPLVVGKPTIATISRNADGSYHLTGTQFNGVSAGAFYGDDNQMNSNFPIVRFTNSLGQVFYARTYNWSHTGVMTGNTPVSTEFTLPEGMPVGQYGLVVVANGIASEPISFVGGSSLGVSPSIGFAATGYSTGPFGPINSLQYSLTNSGGTPLNWAAASSAPWLILSSSGGTIPPGAATSVTVSINSAAATNLLIGDYEAGVTLSNLNDGGVIRRKFALHIQPPPELDFNGSFEAYDFETFQAYLWTLVAGDPLLNGAGPLFIGHTGNACLFLGDTNSPGAFQQILPTTPGAHYLLSFWVKTFGSNTVPYFAVSWNGSALYQTNDLPPLQEWTYFEFLVTATNSASVLKFEGQGVSVSTNDFAVTLVDDVQLIPVAVPTILSSSITNGTFQFTWHAFPDLNYQLQYATNLTQHVWQDLGNPITPVRYFTTSADLLGSDRQRFYRVKLAR